MSYSRVQKDPAGPPQLCLRWPLTMKQAHSQETSTHVIPHLLLDSTTVTWRTHVCAVLSVSVLLWPQPGHKQSSHHWGPELPVVTELPPSKTPTPDFYSFEFQNAMWMESVSSFLKWAFFTWDDSSVNFQAVCMVSLFSLLLIRISWHGGAMINLSSHLWMDTWLVSSLCS